MSCGDNEHAKQMYSETLHTGRSNSQPGTQSEFSISSPHPTGTAAGRPPCVFVLLCLSATCRSSGCSLSASANHGAPQVATEARQGGVLSADGVEEELTWDVFICRQRDRAEWKIKGNETGERDREREGGRACLWNEVEKILVGGKRSRGRGAGRGAEQSSGSRGGSNTQHWTLNLCYRYFHSSAISHCFGS